MNLKTWLPLVLAVVLGLTAMKVARDMMSREKTIPAGDNGTAVVVMKNNASAGTTLSAADLSMVSMSGEVNSAAVFTNPTELEGRVLLADVVRGTPLASPMLAPKGVGSGLQALIPDGMRAITVEINELTGVAGNLAPGCRVDVVATFSGDGGEMLSRTIVQNVKVQAMGMRQQADPAAPVKSVTLLATPKEAEAIELACATGRPRLVLRPGADNDTEQTQGVTVAELRGGTGRNTDPFAVQPVEYLTPTPTVEPTTKPVQGVINVDSRPDQRPRTIQRKVQVIRGGNEGIVTFEELAVPTNPRWITGTNTDELPATDDR